MPKFFVNNNQIKDNVVTIEGTDVNHIVNVLRMEKEDKIKICNIETEENYIAEIIEKTQVQVKCKILEKLDSEAEANIHINILQGLPKADKMELIIQKCTELGVKEITPVAMERCIVKLEDKSANKKIDRWQKIAEIACKQSGRDKITKINNVINIKNICKMLLDYDIVLVAYENEKENTLKKELQDLKILNKENLKIAILIGPEGGIENQEIEFLKENGAKVITLGKRILRTETVAIVISSIIMYELDNF